MDKPAPIVYNRVTAWMKIFYKERSRCLYAKENDCSGLGQETDSGRAQSRDCKAFPEKIK